jgi:hypothetical protein
MMLPSGHGIFGDAETHMKRAVSIVRRNRAAGVSAGCKDPPRRKRSSTWSALMRTGQNRSSRRSASQSEQRRVEAHGAVEVIHVERRFGNVGWCGHGGIVDKNIPALQSFSPLDIDAFQLLLAATV